MDERARSVHEHFGREPWRWHAEATDEDRAAQAAWQAEQTTRRGFAFGAGVFVSPEATVGCERLRLGDRTVVASEAQLGRDVTLGSDCTVKGGRPCGAG